MTDHVSIKVRMGPHTRSYRVSENDTVAVFKYRVSSDFAIGRHLLEYDLRLDDTDLNPLWKLKHYDVVDGDVLDIVKRE